MLGLIIDANKLTIAIPHKYVIEVCNLQNFTWHPNQRCFKVSEAPKLTGKYACLAEGANWVFHLLSQIYLSIAFALPKNKRLLLESSHEFCAIVEALQTGAFLIPCKDLAWHMLFSMKWAAKLMHHALYKYNIKKMMHKELEFFCDKLKPDLGILWETPIPHLIPYTPFPTTIGNSSLDCVGGFSIALCFWWHLSFPDKVIQCMLPFKTNNKDGILISINIIEFVTVIMNYCAAIHIIKTTPLTDDPHPGLLNITYSISASNWTIHTCKCSKLGCLLAHFFCSLLIDLPSGINS
jgi:hypothetical protein